jgi:PsbP-like protein
MIKVKFFLLSVLLVAVAVGDAIFVSNGLSGTITAQLVNETSAGTKPRIQTMYPESMFDTNGSTMGNMIPYNNPSLGFSLEYPSDWQKDDSQPDAPTLISPPGGSGNMAPEIINVGTEVLPSSNFGLDSYTDAAIGQVQSFQDFRLLNSSSTTLGGLPAHMIVYTYTDEEDQIPLQNLQAWTVKDGIAYIITYGGTPDEFDSSLPTLQSVMDSFRFE